ncbi:hypothetical protein WKI68_31360 [Streptomyces sp. MS1.HAVA.3]|uniref:Integral membrane protein n=1 Tax=Streptomyces caledonius TaxID=3134107 RepID=A0ABU8U9L1_9ACTN
MSGIRAARIAATAVVPAELALVVCLAAGVRLPGWALAAAEVLVLGVVLLEAWALGRLYAAERARGAAPGRPGGRRCAPWSRPGPAAAVARAARHRLPRPVDRAREARGAPGDLAAGYTGPQTAMMYGMVFVSVVETVALAFLIPWPAVHRVVLVLDVYGVVIVLALHAACVTRPHVVRPDGSLRIRYGALFDLVVPPDAVASVRVDRRYPEGRLVTLSEDGVLDLIVGSQTTVTLELNRPLPFTRPLGAVGEARTIRFHADDPRALVGALRQPA